MQHEPPPGGPGDPFAEQMQPTPVPALLLAPFMPVTVVRRQLAKGGVGAAWVLFMVNGYLSVLDRFSSRSMGDTMDTGSLLLMAIPIGVLGGLIQGLLGPWLIRLTSGWLGGDATTAQLRIATIWGLYPSLIANAANWIGLLLVYGDEMFTTATPKMDAEPAALFASLALALVALPWTVVNMSRSVGDTAGIGGLKGFLALLLVFAMFVGFFLGLGLIVVVLAGVGGP